MFVGYVMLSIFELVLTPSDLLACSLFWQVFMCFLIDSNELYQVRVKEIQKKAPLAFYCALFVENWKIRKIPYILIFGHFSGRCRLKISNFDQFFACSALKMKQKSKFSKIPLHIPKFLLEVPTVQISGQEPPLL